MCKKTIENILDDLENKMKKKYYCLDCNYKSNNWYAMINHAKDNLNHTITSNGTITVDQNLNLI